MVTLASSDSTAQGLLQMETFQMEGQAAHASLELEEVKPIIPGNCSRRGRGSSCPTRKGGSQCKFTPSIYLLTPHLKPNPGDIVKNLH